MSKLGGKVIDTARAYGRSEEVIGQLLSELGNRNSYFLSTKTPIRGELGAPEVELQASFDRLRVKTIDLMLIHNLHGLDALMPAFIDFKKQGRIRYIGMSTSVDAQYEAQMEGMRKYPLDFIQVDYSIANRGAADAILPLAQERKIAVLVNVPFGGRWPRRGQHVRPGGQRAAARLGEGVRRGVVGAGVPEVRRVASGRDDRDSGHDADEEPRRQPGRLPRPAARCRDAQADRAVLGHALSPRRTAHDRDDDRDDDR